MVNFNKKEKIILSIILASWSIFLIASGIIMNKQIKPIINTRYTINIEMKKIAEQQAKTNEIKLKDIEIEINNPLSVDIKDYLEDYEKISEATIKVLKLDTSLVNINQAGSYQYKIVYKKKTYIGTVKVKEKELPNMNFTLKTIQITTLKEGESLSANPRSYIEEEITDEVYNNLTLDISKVNPTVQGDYTYYIIYKGVTYQGKIEVRNPGPTIITSNNQTEENNEKKDCPSETTLQDNQCVCIDKEKTYDSEQKKCIDA